MVVHQAQDADGAGGDVQQLQHLLGRGKGQPGGADLLGEELGLEGLLAGHDQQVHLGLLAVGQQQVLADLAAQQALHFFTGFNGIGMVMIHPPVFETQGVQQVIAALLLGDARVGRAALVQGMVYLHILTSCWRAARCAAAPLF